MPEAKQLDDNAISLSIPGSGRWFRNHAAFAAWAESSKSCALWVHSPPGYGKTNLASRIAELGNGMLPEDTIVATFFCKGDYRTADEGGGGNVLRHCLSQAAWSEREKKFNDCVIAEYDTYCKDGPGTGRNVWPGQRLHPEECRAMLVTISKERPIVFVLDGLDDYGLRTREAVMRNLRYVSTHCCQPVKVILFSSKEQNIVSLERISPIHHTRLAKCGPTAEIGRGI